MTFSSLPPELKLLIVEYLDPCACFEFGLTCKAYWQLCKHLIKIHEQHCPYETIDADETFGSLGPGVLWTLLDQIQNGDCAGQHVRHIYLPKNRTRFINTVIRPRDNAQSWRGLPSRQDIEHYTPATRQIEKFYETELGHLLGKRGFLEDEILKNATEPILTVLIHKVPYMKSFRFMDDEDLREIFLKVLSAIATLYDNPAVAPKLPFQHLTTVAMSYDEYAYGDDMRNFSAPRWCNYFCSIPSVRNFIARGMGGEPHEPVNERLPASKVKELVFLGSRFLIEDLEGIVRNTSALETFSYEVSECSEQVIPHRSRDIIMMLSEHLGPSLQHINVEDYGVCEDDYIDDDKVTKVDLRDFRKLKTLRIEWRLLWPPDWDGPEMDQDEELSEGFYQDEDMLNREFDVHSILPASLEVLCLVGTFNYEEMEEVKKSAILSELTPLLKKVSIFDTERGSWWDGDDDDGADREDEDEGRLLPVSENPLMQLIEGIAR